VVAPFLPDDEKLAAVREALPAVGAGIYLDTPVAGPLPAETARSMADLAGWEVTTGRAGRDRREEALSRVDEARGAVAAILTTDVDSVALTHGVRDAIAIASAAVDPLADIVVFDPEVEDPEEQIRPLLAHGPRLVVVEHVDPWFGELLPVRDIARLVHELGSFVLVDGSQAAGAIPVAFDDLEADFYAVPGSTWLLGPEGIGALAVGPRHRAKIRLSGGHGTGSTPLTVGHPAPFSFHLPSVVGLGRSCGWLSMYVGLDWIHARVARLARHAANRLALIDGVKLLTPPESLATIVTFRANGWTAERLLEELGARVFAIASVLQDANAVRIGTGFFNTEEEIDRFADAVALLAAHTPETVPPSRRLTVLGGAS
jgi:L-cysteine/cystine lyase